MQQRPFPLWFYRNSPLVYEIDVQGLRDEMQLYRWQNILDYEFENHPELGCVRILILQVRTEPEQISEVTFSLNPTQVTEQQIRELIKPRM